jgi:hypothetical protein
MLFSDQDDVAMVGYIDLSLNGGWHRLGDVVETVGEWVNGEWGMTIAEREQALSQVFMPSDIDIRHVEDKLAGYSNDGKTVLFDEDGDGVWDTAFQRGSDGSVYRFDDQGWEPVNLTN